MRLSENQTMWGEEAIKEFFKEFPELESYGCSFVALEHNPTLENMLGIIKIKTLPLVILVIIQGSELMSFDSCIINNKIEYFNADVAKELTSTEFASGLEGEEEQGDQSDFPDNDQSYNVYNLDSELIGQTIVDPSTMTSVIPGVFNILGDFGGKIASMKKMARHEVEELIEKTLMERLDFQDRVKIARLVGDKFKFYPETGIFQVAYDTDKDRIYGTKMAFDGSEVQLQDVDLASEGLSDYDDAAQSAALGLKEVPTMGKITIVKMKCCIPTEMSGITDGSGMFTDAGGDNIFGLIKSLLSLDHLGGETELRDDGLAGVFLDEGNDVVYSDAPVDGVEGIPYDYVGEQLPVSPEEAEIGDKIAFITPTHIIEPMKVASVEDGIKVANAFNREFKVAFSQYSKPLYHKESETLFLPEGSKIAKITKTEKNYAKPIKTAYMDIDITGDDFVDDEKTAGRRMEVVVYIKKKAGEYIISANAKNTGMQILKGIRVRGEQGLIEQLKELGVPAGGARGVADKMRKYQDAPSFEITGWADSSDYEDISMKKAYIFDDEKQAALIKAAFELEEEGDYKNMIKLFGSSVISPDNIDKFDDLGESIDELTDDLKEYALMRKMMNEQEKADTVYKAVEILNSVKNI